MKRSSQLHSRSNSSIRIWKQSCLRNRKWTRSKRRPSKRRARKCKGRPQPRDCTLSTSNQLMGQWQSAIESSGTRISLQIITMIIKDNHIRQACNSHGQSWTLIPLIWQSWRRYWSIRRAFSQKKSKAHRPSLMAFSLANWMDRLRWADHKPQDFVTIEKKVHRSVRPITNSRRAYGRRHKNQRRGSSLQVVWRSPSRGSAPSQALEARAIGTR